eukprot:1554384-Pyramimonas_sp.AAC.1
MSGYQFARVGGVRDIQFRRGDLSQRNLTSSWALGRDQQDIATDACLSVVGVAAADVDLGCVKGRGRRDERRRFRSPEGLRVRRPRPRACRGLEARRFVRSVHGEGARGA